MDSAGHHLAVYDIEVVGWKRELSIQIVDLKVQIIGQHLRNHMWADVQSHDLLFC